MTADVVLDALYRATGSIPRGSDVQKNCRCPAHEDRSPSLSIRLDAEKVLLHCHAGCQVDDILAALELTPADLFNQPLEREQQRDRPADDTWMPCQDRGHKRVAQYLYTDEHHQLVHGVVRCDAKDFYQWRPDPAAKSGRRWRLNDEQGKRLVRSVPYRLPQILKAIAGDKVIWLAEGEKDVHALVEHGLEATCNAGGSGKWTAEHAQFFKGADVTIVADRDKAGRQHAEAVVETLRGIARSVYVVQAADGGPKDAHDHFAAGYNDTQFIHVWAPVPYPGDPAVTE